MSDFTGTRHLIRLVLRRDRIRLPIWVLAITALVGSTAGAVIGLYDTPAKMAGYARTADGPATKLLSGRPEGLDNAGAITAYEISVTGLVALSLMVIFLVVRHTRAEEETGRAELLRSTVSGRHAGVLAAVTVAAAASLLIGGLDAVVLIAAGLDADGSLLHGAVLAATGLVFTAVAAAAAQVTAASRGALGIAGGVLAFLFVLRGIGDLGSNFLTWLSPLGWALMSQPFGAARWWVLAPLVVLAGVLVVLTTWLTAHRDAGAGLLHAGPGSPRAPASLGTATGLAWRLQRGAVFGWAIGVFLGGAMLGSVGPAMNDMLASNPDLQRFFDLTGGSPVDAFLVTAFALMAVVAAGFAVSSALRLRSEEALGRAEVLLATGMSRTRWAVGSLTVTLLGTVAMMLLVGLGTAVTFALTTGDGSTFGNIMASALVQTPGVLFLAAVAVLLTGWLPRFSNLAYLLLAFVFVQIYLGALLKFPDWVNGMSPFHYLPGMPLADFAAVPTVAVLGSALALAGVGVVGLRRRDLA